MADIRRMEIVIDRDAELGPQLEVYRAIAVPWKFLEQLTGKPKNRLEETLARWRERAGSSKPGKFALLR